jgi:peptide/nickel transport system substrate-binding protein
VAIAPNQLHPDPVMKQLFGDVRFRQALSLAINRDEINELVFLGQGTPRQATINESASFFKKEWAEHFAKFDLDQANKLLDAVGLDKKGADGVRLRPDGKPMQFLLEYLPHEGPKKQTLELVVKHWAKVGLKAEAAERERAFLLTRLNASQHDISGWHVDRQLERASYTYGSTQKLGPGGDSAITWGKPWRDWFISGGKSGQEPPQEAKDLFDAYAKWQETVLGTPEFAAAAVKVHDLIAKNLWVIGIIGQGPQPVVVKNALENVFLKDDKTRLWWGAANWFWLSHAAEQWFFKS